MDKIGNSPNKMMYRRIILLGKDIG